jgi:serine protease SohB
VLLDPKPLAPLSEGLFRVTIKKTLVLRKLSVEFIYELGLFIAKALVFVISGLMLIFGMAAVAVKNKVQIGQLEMTNLSEKWRRRALELKAQVLPPKAYKAETKEQKRVSKQLEKTPQKNTFVIGFKGSIDAKEVASLREEISAVLDVATSEDEVVVTVESGGGMVHGYGLAASQLARIRAAQIPLTVCIDKVAASGGYMMACVADRIVAAPFAIVGSIGVIAQIPNFNKILKKNDIEFEQHTAGEFKRTLTMFGSNTDEARNKFKQELEETHQLFKAFVTQYRPNLDIKKVATGEHWFGQQALDLELVDQLKTSDDWLQQRSKERTVYQLKYQKKQKLTEKMAQGAAMLVDETLLRMGYKRS